MFGCFKFVFAFNEEGVIVPMSRTLLRNQKIILTWTERKLRLEVNLKCRHALVLKIKSTLIKQNNTIINTIILIHSGKKVKTGNNFSNAFPFCPH